MAKIFIVSELFYPDTCTTAHILTKIADRLSKQHEVSVICGPSGYDNSQILSESDKLNNIDIIRIGKSNFDKNNIPQRILKFVTLTCQLTNELRKRVDSKDEVLIVTNPAPLMVFISGLKYFKHFNLTILVHDVFPENTIPAGIFKSESNILYRLIRKVFNKAYSTADRLIVLGRDMKDMMNMKIANSRRKPDVTIIENWSEHADCISETNVSPKVNILYAGNIGRVQGLEFVINALQKTTNKDLNLTLRGSGAMLDHITDNYPFIQYEGSFNRENQFEILSKCDIALVTLSKGMYGLGVPSKTYNILAAGKPILYIGDPRSEVSLLIKENNIGWSFAPENTNELIEFLNLLSVDMRPLFKEMGTKAKLLSEQIYTEDKILKKYELLYLQK